MDTIIGDLDGLSRPELISLYINGYYTLDAGLKSKFEAAFKERKLPLPRMPETPPVPKAAPSIDRKCFLSYILLMYTGTGIFYSWFFLAARLLKMDFRDNLKHKLIQTGIALLYVVGELLLIGYFRGAN